MNKTEYMNTLQQELQGLPTEQIDETMWVYEQKFVDGMVAGSSEAEIAAKLPNPRLVAAQKRASTRVQKLGSNYKVANLFGLLIATIGLLFLNGLMLMPVIFYGLFVFVSYIISLLVYGLGIGLFAASVSGVGEMEFKLPHHSYHDRGHVRSRDVRGFNHDVGRVTVDINTAGVLVNRDGVAQTDGLKTLERHWDGRVGAQDVSIHISNRLTGRNVILGIGVMGIGIALLLLCLMLTRLTFIGFKKYVLWNLSLLRSAMQS
ncbi:MAG: DUF1700 domain-containing protein [Undibacterium sp.]|nr:DUF1700 domain-containing protein [Undibacterium sp.]